MRYFRLTSKRAIAKFGTNLQTLSYLTPAGTMAPFYSRFRVISIRSQHFPLVIFLRTPYVQRFSELGGLMCTKFGRVDSPDIGTEQVYFVLLRNWTASIQWPINRDCGKEKRLKIAQFLTRVKFKRHIYQIFEWKLKFAACSDRMTQPLLQNEDLASNYSMAIANAFTILGDQPDK